MAKTTSDLNTLFTLVPFLYLSFISNINLATTMTIKSANPSSSASSFITTSCRSTTYPSVCIQSLSAYASTINRDPKQLATTALTVSIDRAQSAKTFIAKLARFRGLRPREKAAIKDCLEQISDSVDRLSKSVQELKSISRWARGGLEFRWHMSNVQTWVSAALTDDTTCMDEFSDGRESMNGRIKASVRARVGRVAQVTSNALALCNKYALNN